MAEQPRTAVLIVAAGRGQRAAGTRGGPKQYATLGGGTVLSRTLEAFAHLSGIDLIQVVIHPDDIELYGQAIAGMTVELLPAVMGGATRQASVNAGLEALAPHAPREVLIHDAARPFVSAGIIQRVRLALETADGAIPAIALADTLKRADSSGRIVVTLDRKGLWRVQTPQGFRFDAILSAHRQARADSVTDLTDDAAVAERAGMTVVVVEGEEANKKITTAEDLAMAQLAVAAPAWETRVGTGFDVHRFADGDHVWLCGVRVPHTHRLEGHSDADVGLHALTDALLGAIGDGDIGQHFPPSDPRWKGAASRMFLEDAARRVRDRGGVIVNVDVTLLCEAPKIAPHSKMMRAVMADILAIAEDRVGVKATTTERLGFTGRREGIAAQAVAAVRLPVA